MSKITIDKEKCTKCGLCMSDCICSCLEPDEDGYPRMRHTNSCLGCQHCFSICPNGALSFDGKNPDDSEPTSTDNILSLIKSRRSIRQYKDEEISDSDMTKIKEMLPYNPFTKSKVQTTDRPFHNTLY